MKVHRSEFPGRGIQRRHLKCPVERIFLERPCLPKRIANSPGISGSLPLRKTSVDPQHFSNQRSRAREGKKDGRGGRDASQATESPQQGWKYEGLSPGILLKGRARGKGKEGGERAAGSGPAERRP